MAGPYHNNQVNRDPLEVESWLVGGQVHDAWKQNVSVTAGAGKIYPSSTPLKITTAADNHAGTPAVVEAVAPGDTINGFLYLGLDAEAYARNGSMVKAGILNINGIQWPATFVSTAQKETALGTIADNFEFIT